MTTTLVLKALGRAARSARETAGVKREEVAIKGGCGYDTVGRFERGNNWPQKPNELLAAYSELSGVTESDLWKEALEAIVNPAEAGLQKDARADESLSHLEAEAAAETDSGADEADSGPR